MKKKQLRQRKVNKKPATNRGQRRIARNIEKKKVYRMILEAQLKAQMEKANNPTPVNV